MLRIFKGALNRCNSNFRIERNCLQDCYRYAWEYGILLRIYLLMIHLESIYKKKCIW